MLVALCLVLLIGVAAYVQWANPTPIDSVTLSPIAAGPSYIWGAAVYGTGASQISGNSTSFGTTLLLNSIRANQSATANYSISFVDFRDLHEYADTFTLYVPGQLAFASSALALTVIVDGLTFSYHPSQATNYSWYDANPAYIASNASLVPLPSVFNNPGNTRYLAFTFNSSTLAQNEVVQVSIAVPAGGQIYLPNLVFTASLLALAADQPLARTLGLATLPLTGGAIAGIYLLLRRCGAGRYLGALAAGFGLQVALAPWFMHPDLLTQIRYSHLAFNYGVVNFQGWSYGLLWFVAILAPVAPAFAAGAAPTLSEWGLLLKLPAIAADLLIFLLIIRALAPRWGETRAYRFALVGWLFNPLILFFTVIAGQAEVLVALFVTLAGMALYDRRTWAGVTAAVVAVLTILPAVFLVPPMLLSRRVSWPQRVALVAAPILAYLAVYLSLYHTTDGIEAYVAHLVGRVSPSTLSLGASSNSWMTFLQWPLRWFGIYVPLEVGVAFLVVGCVALCVQQQELLPQRAFLALYAALCAFYFTYEVFYVQHLLWAFPLLIGLVALSPRIRWAGAAAFVAAFSAIGLAVDLTASGNHILAGTLAVVLFTWMLIPILVWLPGEWIRGLFSSVARQSLRTGGAGLSLSLALAIGVAGGSPALLPVIAAVAALAFLALTWTGWDRSGGELPIRAARAVLEALAIGLVLCLVYLSGPKLPVIDLALVGGATLFAMAELVCCTLEWIQTPAASPSGVAMRPEGPARAATYMSTRRES